MNLADIIDSFLIWFSKIIIYYDYTKFVLAWFSNFYFAADRLTINKITNKSASGLITYL